FARKAARQAAELASHREAAAQYRRAVRFADGQDARVRAVLYDGLATELSLIDGWLDAAEAEEQALRLWREVGDPLREGAVLRLLSRTMWRLCRGSEAMAAAAAAIAVLEPLGPSREVAMAFANLAGHRMQAGDSAAAIKLADEAVAIAEPLGFGGTVSDALDTQACALFQLGDEDWTALMERAL